MSAADDDCGYPLELCGVKVPSTCDVLPALRKSDCRTTSLGTASTRDSAVTSRASSVSLGDDAVQHEQKVPDAPEVASSQDFEHQANAAKAHPVRGFSPARSSMRATSPTRAPQAVASPARTPVRTPVRTPSRPPIRNPVRQAPSPARAVAVSASPAGRTPCVGRRSSSQPTSANSNIVRPCPELPFSQAFPLFGQLSADDQAFTAPLERPPPVPAFTKAFSLSQPSSGPSSRRSSLSRCSGMANSRTVSQGASEHGSVERVPAEIVEFVVDDQSRLVIGEGIEQPRLRHRAHSTCSSRGSSCCPSTQTSARSLPKGKAKDETRQKVEDAQRAEALAALVQAIGNTQPLGDLCCALLDRVVTRAGTAAFSEDLVRRTVEEVAGGVGGIAGAEFIDATGGKGPEALASREKAAMPSMSPPSRPPLRPSSAASSRPSSASASSRPSSASSRPVSAKVRSSSRSGNASNNPVAVAVLRVLTKLAESSKMPVADVIGQILYRHRRAEPLLSPQHRKTVEDTSWVECGDDVTFVKGVARVFRVITHADSGRMRQAHWSKAVHLLMKSPLLQDRVSLSDTDRLFYCECRRACSNTQCQANWRSIGLRAFKRLLLEVAEASRVHPWMVFIAVGCHADTMEMGAALENGGRTPRATSSSSAPSTARTIRPPLPLASARR
eukprot:gnl/TRDRNA2_/TRDRNA2_125851_c0_seq1.p1 gnl/TRDRNA2_/TRDRNA2_125851_c0~~gnl/TRDRNA2_/TRDRNA2_125851_c0_seq1.p1  ORF type:complete len:671 (+),score=70.73 gnl/TRDRNA2_/TRDRNA2_125851_c0_seq1:76-2088(+)